MISIIAQLAGTEDDELRVRDLRPAGAAVGPAGIGGDDLWIYRVASGVLTISFYIPWYSVAIAVGSVFAVVFATMLYATRKLRQDDLVETLKSGSF